MCKRRNNVTHVNAGANVKQTLRTKQNGCPCKFVNTCFPQTQHIHSDCKHTTTGYDNIRSRKVINCSGYFKNTNLVLTILYRYCYETHIVNRVYNIEIYPTTPQMFMGFPWDVGKIFNCYG